MLLALHGGVSLSLNYGTASLLEILWTIGAVCGAIVTAYNLWQAWLDHQWLVGQKDFMLDGPRDLIARRNLHNQGTRFFLLVLMLLTGIVALLTPPAQETDTPSFYAVMLTVMILSAEAALTWNSLYDYRNRRRLLESLERVLRTRQGAL